MRINESVNNEGNPLRDLSNIKSIILHHTGTNADSHKFLNRDDYISCHYLIKRDGSIWHLMDDDRVAYHAGVSSWKTLQSKGRSLNWCTIGIEIEGDGVQPFTSEQKKSNRELVKHLMNKYSISEELVLSHKMIAPKRKWDVSDILWNDKYKTWQDYIKSINSKTMYSDEKLEKLKLDVIFAAKALYAYGSEMSNMQATDAASKVGAIIREIQN